MIDEPTSKQVFEHSLAASRPRQVILFGSYGRGDAGEGADSDITVFHLT
jgi:uncharacterized protein